KTNALAEPKRSADQLAKREKASLSDGALEFMSGLSIWPQLNASLILSFRSRHVSGWTRERRLEGTETLSRRSPGLDRLLQGSRMQNIIWLVEFRLKRQKPRRARGSSRTDL